MINWLITLTFVFLVSIIGIQRVVEKHHGYWGFIVALVGIGAGWHYVALFGLIVLGEDAYQHLVQLMYQIFQEKKLPDFSVMHWIGVWIILFYRRVSPTNSNKDAKATKQS